MNSNILKITLLLIITILSMLDAAAQSKLEGREVEISNNGIRINKSDDDEKKPKVHKKIHTKAHFDLGINNVIDETEYADVQNLLLSNGPNSNFSSKDLELNTGKSINVNFWPVLMQADLISHNLQLETGLGFQIFNWRYNAKIVHTDYDGNPSGENNPYFIDRANDPNLNGKEKNKLGVSYVSVPFMLRINSNKFDGHRFSIAAGVIGSYKLKSWTKFYGQKNAGSFGINDIMTQLTAEIGVSGILKLYGTYALQPMFENGLERTPFAIGVRF